MNTFANSCLVAERVSGGLLLAAALVLAGLARAPTPPAPRTPAPPSHTPVHTLQFRQPRLRPDVRLAARWVAELRHHHGCPPCTIACLSASLSLLLT
ncbi:hypothetical protein [Hymenobacter latericus]|uniref:hypothetical protein n=1 Tax=Hymenobacter sp. YIM 151858-1 TaxID=2987688 RepID=UPI0022267FB6|nr:hypothetical protein [Hymenobacter sp. YIM 151858-1]UYZ57617.1 hypothetical protein OIS50_11100 [Hymenobacter sp. YIM 151858-1]